MLQVSSRCAFRRKKGFLSFEEARRYMQGVGLKSAIDWHIWSRKFRPSSTIPGNPRQVYKESGWAGLPDFLGYDEPLRGSAAAKPFDADGAGSWLRGLLGKHVGWDAFELSPLPYKSEATALLSLDMERNAFEKEWVALQIRGTAANSPASGCFHFSQLTESPDVGIVCLVPQEGKLSFVRANEIEVLWKQRSWLTTHMDIDVSEGERTGRQLHSALVKWWDALPRRKLYQWGGTLFKQETMRFHYILSQQASRLLYRPAGFQMVYAPDSRFYNAVLGQHRVLHRRVEVQESERRGLPLRLDRFSSRYAGKETKRPLTIADEFDVVIAMVHKAESLLGVFVFPKALLVAKGVVGGGDGPGVYSLAVYPPFVKPEVKQAKISQVWQRKYFIDLSTREADALGEATIQNFRNLLSQSCYA